MHEGGDLAFGLQVLRDVHVHFVSVEVRVERGAVRLVHPQHSLLGFVHFDSEAHHGGFVQGGLPVEDDHVSVHQVAQHSLRVDA